MNCFERAKTIVDRLGLEVHDWSVDASTAHVDQDHLMVDGSVDIYYCLDDGMKTPKVLKCFEETGVKGQVKIGNAGLAEDLNAEVEWAAQEISHLGSWAGVNPFMKMANGHFLAVKPDIGVVYLDHTSDELTLIHPDPLDFWDIWSGLCFLGPEFWYLECLCRDDLRVDMLNHRGVKLLKQLDGMALL